jgi:hypothetical protein
MKTFIKIAFNAILIVAVAYVITMVGPNVIYICASALPPIRDPYIVWVAFYWLASLLEIFVWFLRPLTQGYLFYNPEAFGGNVLNAPPAYTLIDMSIWVIILAILVYAEKKKKALT